MKKFIFRLLSFIIFSVLGFNIQALADNIKFIQVADSHLSITNPYTSKVLESAVDDINNQPDVSFVVFTGDNIANPKEENLKEFMRIVKKLKAPYYIALGNHDVYKANGLSKVRYYEVIKENSLLQFQKTPNYAFKKDGFLFLIVDGAKEVVPGTVGYYKQETLDWVDKQLSKNKKKDVVIFQHFPIEYPAEVESRLKTHKTYRVEDYQNILAKHTNVLAVVTGHFHVNDETMKNGVYHISTPTVLALPQSYKVIDIVTTKEFSPIIYTQLREFKVNE